VEAGTEESRVKRRLSAPARRARIAEAALAAFASGGYRSTSMAAIAARADVTRTVLYDHFESKRALFLAVLEAENAAFLAHVAERIGSSGEKGERMRRTMDTVFSFAEERPDGWRLLFRDASYGDGQIDAAVQAIHRARIAAVVAMLAADAESVGIDPAGRKAEAMVEMLIAALRGGVEWRRRYPDATREELVDAGMDLLWSGLGRLG